MHTTVHVPGISSNVLTMELAASDLWAALRQLSIHDLKALAPTGPYVKLIDALIDVRYLMENPHGK